jgi:uncharacterized protein (TIGR02271 family)
MKEMSMATTKRKVAVGVFDSRERAQQAVNELRRMGFTESQIGVAGREGGNIEGASDVHGKGTSAAAGAGIGAATGAGLGALWGLGILAGVMPVIGPAIAGGTLATILSSAAAGAVAAGIGGALVGLGVPSDEAEYYESEFKAGRFIVTVTANGRYDEVVTILHRFGGYDISTRREKTGKAETRKTTSHEPSTVANRSDAGRTIQVKEEELHVQKQPVNAGEVRVHKEVHTEHKTLEVPVKKEEVVVERRPASGRQTSATGIGENQEIRIPVREEQVHVEKQPVVKEEVTVGKREVSDTQQVSGTVRKEEVKIDKQGDVNVRGNDRSKRSK